MGLSFTPPVGQMTLYVLTQLPSWEGANSILAPICPPTFISPLCPPFSALRPAETVTLAVWSDENRWPITNNNPFVTFLPSVVVQSHSSSTSAAMALACQVRSREKSYPGNRLRTCVSDSSCEFTKEILQQGPMLTNTLTLLLPTSSESDGSANHTRRPHFIPPIRGVNRSKMVCSRQHQE